MLFDHPRNSFLQNRGVSLAGDGGVALRVHEYEGRPGAGAVLVPGRAFRDIQDRVAHIVTRDGALQCLVVALVLELWRVGTYHDEAPSKRSYRVLSPSRM